MNEHFQYIESSADILPGTSDCSSGRNHEGPCKTRTNVTVPGLDPDTPTVTHADGGKESHVPYAFASIDPLALFHVAQVQKGGDEKYGPDNWRRISERDHINHALAHIYGHLAEDSSDYHLEHAATRLLCALAVHLRPGFYGLDKGSAAESG